jgi:predicted esterase YcpF (UPF0227 family)
VSAEAFAISEHARMISNMIRVGSVVELDTEKGLVKVRAGGVVSDWIHFACGTRAAMEPATPRRASRNRVSRR